VNQKDYYLEQQEEQSLEERVIGEIINPRAENSWMILTTTDLIHLLLLSTNGYSEKECLRIGKSKSSGNVKSFQELKQLMESASIITATSEQ